MATVAPDPLRRALLAELERRRGSSPRYSLRAYAASLGIDHSSLSRILRSRRIVNDRNDRAPVVGTATRS